MSMEYMSIERELTFRVCGECNRRIQLDLCSYGCKFDSDTIEERGDSVVLATYKLIRIEPLGDIRE